nr:MAG TPA: hypothetical protein [Caudoviricetes sp.]
MSCMCVLRRSLRGFIENDSHYQFFPSSIVLTFTLRHSQRLSPPYLGPHTTPALKLASTPLPDPLNAVLHLNPPSRLAHTRAYSTHPLNMQLKPNN